MSDIVERARKHMESWPKMADYWAGDMADKLLDEIERLQAIVDEMKVAP